MLVRRGFTQSMGSFLQSSIGQTEVWSFGEYVTFLIYFNQTANEIRNVIFHAAEIDGVQISW
jgi:hypothetical protein